MNSDRARTSTSVQVCRPVCSAHGATSLSIHVDLSSILPAPHVLRNFLLMIDDGRPEYCFCYVCQKVMCMCEPVRAALFWH